MDTLLVLKDSVTIVNEATCHTCVKEVECSWQYVLIVLFACASILVVVNWIINGLVKPCLERKFDKWKIAQGERARIEEQKKKLQNDLLSYLKDKAEKFKKGGSGEENVSDQKFEDVYTKAIDKVINELKSMQDEQK